MKYSEILHEDKEKLSSLKRSFNQAYIKHFDTPKKIDFKDIKNVKVFVFFSFSPHLSFIEFIYQIRKAGKKIVFIQDNHQFSIHQGSVNSIIFKCPVISIFFSLNFSVIKTDVKGVAYILHLSLGQICAIAPI